MHDLTDDDKDLLALEDLFHWLEERRPGMRRVPLRIYTCPACEGPIAATIPADVEVVTAEIRERAAGLAEKLGLPLCDPDVDHFPNCRRCGWKPEHVHHEEEAPQ